MDEEKVKESSLFSKEKKSALGIPAISQRYAIKYLKGKWNDFNLYKGIDLEEAKWVHVYVKQNESSFPLSKAVKEFSRNQLCPKLLWSGQSALNQKNYYVEVHQRYGPSLQSIFQAAKTAPRERELIHLLFELIKLAERMNNCKLVSGQLDPQNIILDPSPKKNDLYLLNCFFLRKRQKQSQVRITKYSSRGAHFGRNIGIKDDLQSICYILIDLFAEGKFLENKNIAECMQQKLSLNITTFAEGLPQILVDFYNYVINLNLDEEIKFYYWKNYLSKYLGETTAQPYAFLMVRESLYQTLYCALGKQSGEGCQTEEQQMDETERVDNIQKVRRVMPNSLGFKLLLR